MTLKLVRLAPSYITTLVQQDQHDKFFRLYQDSEVGLDSLNRLKAECRDQKNDEDVDTDEELL